MQESEFRDWARRAQGAFEERLGRVEARQAEIEAAALAPRVGGRLAAGQVEMAEGLLKAVRGGGVKGMGIVYLGAEGVIDGWSCSGGGVEHHTLLGAIMALADDLMHPEAPRETFYVAAGAAGGTDEGSPAREVARLGPRGGMIGKMVVGFKEAPKGDVSMDSAHEY